MKTVSIRELHNRTGQLVRAASRRGEIRVTDSGRVIARIVPETQRAEVPILPGARCLAVSAGCTKAGAWGRVGLTPLNSSPKTGFDALLGYSQ